MTTTDRKFACLYPVATHGSGDNKWEELCNKIQAEDDVYCPKHRLIVDDATLAHKRRAQKSALARAKKKDMEAFLEISPLRAFK